MGGSGRRKTLNFSTKGVDLGHFQGGGGGNFSSFGPLKSSLHGPETPNSVSRPPLRGGHDQIGYGTNAMKSFFATSKLDGAGNGRFGSDLGSP